MRYLKKFDGYKIKYENDYNLDDVLSSCEYLLGCIYEFILKLENYKVVVDFFVDPDTFVRYRILRVSNSKNNRLFDVKIRNHKNIIIFNFSSIDNDIYDFFVNIFDDVLLNRTKSEYFYLSSNGDVEKIIDILKSKTKEDFDIFTNSKKYSL